MSRPARLPAEEQSLEIIKAASQYLATIPFEQFRLVELAKSLDMSHSNIYRFFGSKEALFDAVVDQWLAASRALIHRTLETQTNPLEKLSALLIAVHESARDKLTNDPNGFALYQHMWTHRSDAANRHLQFIVTQGVALLTEAIENNELAITDPLKAAALIQSATVKFHAPQLIKETLFEDTTAQLKSVLNALFYCFRNDPNCLAEL